MKIKIKSEDEILKKQLDDMRYKLQEARDSNEATKESLDQSKTDAALAKQNAANEMNANKLNQVAIHFYFCHFHAFIYQFHISQN